MSGQAQQVSGRPEPFRLLFVCSGNVCCSPFAQLHTRALLDVRLGRGWASWFSVASAGTAAVVGSAMHPTTRALFGPRAGHADVDAFRARQLPARDVRLADLVLTAGRRHRSAVVELEPRALRTTFTLREFVRLLGGVDLRALPADPVARARALVPVVGDLRGTLPPVPAETDAIADPPSESEADHAVVTRAVDAAVGRLVAVLAGPVGAPSQRPVSTLRHGPPRGPLPPPGPGPMRTPHASGPVPMPLSPVSQVPVPQPPVSQPSPWGSPGEAPAAGVGSVQVGPIRLGAGLPATVVPESAPVPADAGTVTDQPDLEPADEPLARGPAIRERATQ